MNGTEWKEQHAPNLVMKQWQEAIARWVEVKGLPDLTTDQLLADMAHDFGQILKARATGHMETHWDKQGVPRGFPIELGNLLVTMLYLCEQNKISMASELATIMEFNYSRPARIIHPKPEQAPRKEINMEPNGAGPGTIIAHPPAEQEAPKPAPLPPPQGADINQWCKYVNDWAQSKGWNDAPLHIGDQLMLMVTELAEAKEEDRKRPNQPNSYHYEDTDKGPKLCGLPSELADTVIRIFHFCGRTGINLEQVICEKMVYNQKRAYRHGGLAS
jgi:NTP pyrophosphatase (non-canonical NTP hydrolase)